MLEKNINEALIKDKPSIKSLIAMIVGIDKNSSLGEVSLYHKFPLYLDETGSKPITTDILFVSQNFGIFIFKCLEYSERDFAQIDAASEAKSLSQIDRLVFAKILKDSPNLGIRGRSLKVEIQPAMYLHNCSQKPLVNEWSDFKIIISEHELKEIIYANNDGNKLSDDEYKDLKATIEGSKGIAKPTTRTLKDPNSVQPSKGAILARIENDIYNFDLEQKKAALFTLAGAQRIRGLAGSGKTVILAMKAALIHLQNPEATILYTYYTKSLQDLVKKLITRFYRQFAEQDPNWNKIHIMHAWGGRGLEGVYYNTCSYNDITPLNLSQAKLRMPDKPFDYICEQLNRYTLKPQYDYVILDEAQDFPIHFYRICRQITRDNQIIWAYDDFQNILNIKIQDEKETFGKDENGNFFIDFSQQNNKNLQDLVLHKCYRNPRKILLCAFALGLGIYNQDSKTQKTRIIQRLEHNEHWESLGFKVEMGNSIAGDRMVISRPEENSPLLKNHFLDNSDAVIKIKTYESIQNECEAVATFIIDDLNKELNPEDISVIALDNGNIKSYFRLISQYLERHNIKTFSMLDAPNDNTVYKVPGHVTLSTIFKAKGNEAGSVYVVGIDAVFADKNNITERNKLFTAITRSLAWVTLTGLGPEARICIDELKLLERNDFKLVFTQPSEEEVVTIKQSMDKKQATLNKIKWMSTELAKDGGLTEEEVLNLIKRELSPQKQ
jgi:superfamily I DNA and RNA helicase